MADRVRTITLRVQDDASGHLRTVAGAFDSTARSAQNLNQVGNQPGGFMGNAAFNFNQMAQSAMAMSGAITQVLSTANEWAQIGVGAERSKMALQSLVGAGKDYVDMVDAIQEGTHGAVTEGEAAATAYRLMRFNLAGSADEMKNFMRTVSIVAAVNPQLGGTSEAINQIQLTLSNMSFMRLDQLGISAGEVRARMAELKAETTGLSNEAAFQQAVMEELEEQANGLGDEILELDDAQARWNARMRSFKEDAGARAAEGFEGIASAAEGLLIILQKLSEQPWTVIVNLADQAGLGGLNNTAKSGVGTFYDLLPYLQTGTGAAGNVLGAVPYVSAANDIYNLLGGGRGEGSDPYAANNGRQINPATGRYYPQTPWYQQGATGAAMGTASISSAIRASVPITIRGQYGGHSGNSVANFRGASMFAGLSEESGAQWRSYVIADREARWRANTQRSAEQGIGRNVALDDMGAGMLATSMYDRAIPAVQALIDRLGGATRAALELGRNGEIVGNQFSSLNEKFGVVADSFDLDVYSRMSDALQSAEVDATAMGDALTMYEHKVGMANAQTVMFDDLMSDLTDQLKAGNLSALEYTNAVLALGQTDLSVFDRMLAPLRDTNFEMYMTMLDRLQSFDMSQLTALQNLPQNITTFAGRAADFLPFRQRGEGEGADIGIGTDTMDRLQAQLDDMQSMSRKPGLALQDAFETSVARSCVQLDTLQGRLSGMAAGVTIPIDLAISSSGDINITVPVEIDGREVATATASAARRTNTTGAGANTSRMGGR